ncbi:MAG: hypothetical protein AAGG48_28795 [Planctomycetota bacterium]
MQVEARESFLEWLQGKLLNAAHEDEYRNADEGKWYRKHDEQDQESLADCHSVPFVFSK